MISGMVLEQSLACSKCLCIVLMLLKDSGDNVNFK